MAHQLANSKQCVLVLSENWESTNGSMYLFDSNAGAGLWNQHGLPMRVVLGKNGLANGIGMIPLQLEQAPQKKEGDNRAPAGIFQLSSAFGYAEKRNARWVKLPYLAVSDQTEGIDDPASRYYNRLIDRAKVKRVDWQSAEKMRRPDNLYEWGIVVDHNPAAIPGAGSCIFLHIWKDARTPTTGCTAMAEENLLQLLRWLDPSLRPILVQMPRDIYQALAAKFDLPMGFN